MAFLDRTPPKSCGTCLGRGKVAPVKVIQGYGADALVSQSAWEDCPVCLGAGYIREPQDRIDPPAVDRGT